MFTIENGEIFQIDLEKRFKRKAIIQDGTVKVSNKTETFEKVTNIYTLTEIKRKFSSLISNQKQAKIEGKIETPKEINNDSNKNDKSTEQEKAKIE